ncbi:MAG: dTDP-glucose 4,6-dehydratase [Akkermansiaceae bacterium]|nr:dTDP-glucose 4,6-dehydratase [Akkermansiaceae bacterium]
MERNATAGKRVMVTGGCGFIGGHLVRALLAAGHEILNVDKLTYAADAGLIDEFEKTGHHRFFKADIADAALMRLAMIDFRPEWLFHIAAESHVDRSIEDPLDFLRTNLLGTGALLEAARQTYGEGFRFIHVSTDEVYGSLGEEGSFSETSSYAPRSPYSASKAGSDHLVRAWHQTYGLPVIITHCGNNYGTGQFPEKLIPLAISRALNGAEIPIYGSGLQVRDWIDVEDHITALLAVAENGKAGETYDIGARDEWRNIDLVRAICGELDKIRPDAFPEGHGCLIRHVGDRPGHDFRYAINPGKLEAELGWRAQRTLAECLPDLVREAEKR